MLVLPCVGQHGALDAVGGMPWAGGQPGDGLVVLAFRVYAAFFLF